MQAVGIIPAYAGSTPSPSSSSPGKADHPRIRGEHDRVRDVRGARAGSSPHTRGARHLPRRPSIVERIIPAYAGSTIPETRRLQRRADHPRIRGEHAKPSGSSPKIPGSSPHTRGAQRPPREFSVHRGIIPAYAGSTRSPRKVRAWRPDHPRIRGEHGDAVDGVGDEDGSSPHTRGALAG